MIANLAVCSYPVEVLPSIYHYGHAAPFYNVSHATRTILFGTKNNRMLIGCNACDSPHDFHYSSWAQLWSAPHLDSHLLHDHASDSMVCKAEGCGCGKNQSIRG